VDSPIEPGQSSIILLEAPPCLTVDQRNEVKAICDEICQRLEKDEEFTYDLNELRGKTGSFLDEVWDEAMRILRAAGWDARRTGAQILVHKRT
jgi:hypothetical protein